MLFLTVAKNCRDELVKDKDDPKPRKNVNLILFGKNPVDNNSWSRKLHFANIKAKKNIGITVLKISQVKIQSKPV